MVDNFFLFFQLVYSQIKKLFKEKIEGMDPGAPKNPKIVKKFLITTLLPL